MSDSVDAMYKFVGGMLDYIDANKIDYKTTMMIEYDPAIREVGLGGIKVMIEKPNQTTKLENIKTLYEGYFNTNQDTELFAEEFYYAIGELLQGKQLKRLELKHLNVEELDSI